MSRAGERGAHTSTSSAKMRRVGTWLPPESVAVPGLSPPCSLRFFRFFRSSHRPFAALSFSRSNRCSALGIRVATAVTAAAPALCLPKRSASSSPPQSSFFSLLSQTRFLRLVSSPLPASTFSLHTLRLSPNFSPPRPPTSGSPCAPPAPRVRSLSRFSLLRLPTRLSTPPNPCQHHTQKKESGDAFDLLPTTGSRPHILVNVRVASSFSNTAW